MFENGEMAPMAYSHLMNLTYQWYLADSETSKATYHQMAEDFRANDYKTTNGVFPNVDAGIEYMPSMPTGVLSEEEHYFRNQLNLQFTWDDFQKLQERLPDNLKWYIEESDDLHQNNAIGEKDNVKYVSKCGHFEMVFNANNELQALYNNPEDMGTYNYYGPNKWIKHYQYDIYPYRSFGWFGWGYGNVER